MKYTTIMIYPLLLSIFQTLHATEVVRLTNGEWPPYTSEALKHHGVFSHIVTKAFEQEGVRVEYSFYPWKRAYFEAAEGNYDGSVAWAPTEEREKEFHFSDPVTTSKKVFFHLRSYDFHWSTIDDLKALNIGATTHYTYGKEFDEASLGGELNIEYVASDKFNVRKLLHNRIQIFPMEIEVGYSLIHTMLPPEQAALITNHLKPIMQAPICVAFSKKIPAQRASRLQKLLNSGLKKLMASGQYEELIWNSRQGKYKK